MRKATTTEKDKAPGKATVKICDRCGHEILGHYEYVKTKRGSEVYICDSCVKGGQCRL